MKNNFYPINENKALLKKGLITIKNLVGSTLGPVGETIILTDNGNTRVTKDGVTVAEFIHFDNLFLETINSIIKETARKTGKTVGDGTTTSILLACGLMLELLTEDKIDWKLLEKEISIVTSNLQKSIKKLDIFDSNIINILESIVRLSSNNDAEITKLIIGVIKDIGPDGLIDVIVANGETTQVTLQDGILLESLAHVHTTVELDSPFVVLVSGKIDHVHQIKSCMKLANETYVQNKFPFIVVAKEFSNDVKNVITINNANNKFRVYLVESDGFANNMLDILDDMAMLLDCKVLSTDSSSPYGLQNITELQIAQIKSAVITPQQTILHSDYFLHEEAIERKDSILSRIVKLKKLDDGNTGELRGLEKRLTKFSKSATIKVGGVTDMEKIERKDRVDDAVMALHSAVNSGVVYGGGNALYMASEVLGPNSYIKNICSIPVTILSDDLLLDVITLYKKGEVMDFITKESGDPFKLGVLDPADVQIKALTQALAITKSILGSYAVITSIDEI